MRLAPALILRSRAERAASRKMAAELKVFTTGDRPDDNCRPRAHIRPDAQAPRQAEETEGSGEADARQGGARAARADRAGARTAAQSGDRERHGGAGSQTGLKPPPDNSFDRRADFADAHKARLSTPQGFREAPQKGYVAREPLSPASGGGRRGDSRTSGFGPLVRPLSAPAARPARSRPRAAVGDRGRRDAVTPTRRGHSRVDLAAPRGGRHPASGER